MSVFGSWASISYIRPTWGFSHSVENGDVLDFIASIYFLFCYCSGKFREVEVEAKHRDTRSVALYVILFLILYLFTQFSLSERCRRESKDSGQWIIYYCEMGEEKGKTFATEEFTLRGMRLVSGTGLGQPSRKYDTYGQKKAIIYLFHLSTILGVVT